jgi:CheY-like chemotaxis protein
MGCTIFNVGTGTDVQRSLAPLFKAGSSASLEHIETGAMALETLLKLGDPELPQLVITPFRLPIMKGADFIAEMRSHERLRGIPILVWGVHIPADEINRLLAAGATQVLEGHFDAPHLEAARQLCPQCFRSNPGQPRRLRRRYAITAVLRDAGEKAARNARLGALFAWTGCISAVLWIWAFVQLGMSYTEADLAPLPVYAALTSAGFLLMLARVGSRTATR